MFDRCQCGIADSTRRKGAAATRAKERERKRRRGPHLVDVFEFVDDLVHHGVDSLHFDFRVGILSLDPAADHTQGVAADRQTDRLFLKILFT